MKPVISSYANSAPVVYRSLPILVSEVNVLRSSESQVVAPVTNKQDEQQSPAFNDIPVAWAQVSMSNSIVREKLDLSELQRQLSKVCSGCVLLKSPSICELECTTQASDGVEFCKFNLTISRQAGSPNFIIQPCRLSGCAFFFRKILAEVFGDSSCATRHLFRCPPLPSSLTDEEPVDVSSVEAAIRLAKSAWYEQRLQAIQTLARHLLENNEFRNVFRSLDGFERLRELGQDANPEVQHAYARILVVA